jgi:anti-sigma-K factor RskA
MSHCDEDALALLALGEVVDSRDVAHSQECAECSARLEEYRAVVGIGRTVTPDDVPSAPPAEVWAAVSAEVARERDASGVVRSLDSAPSRRRRGGYVLAAAAAVVGLIAGSAVTASVINRPESVQIVASAALDPIGDAGVTGTAVIEQVSGKTTLKITVPDLSAAEDGYYEVWMATADTATMVAIGNLNPGETAEYTLPVGMDLASFPVVDISLEHFDGDPGHSATSVVRGTLGA